jgi:hypothetical protein
MWSFPSTIGLEIVDKSKQMLQTLINVRGHSKTYFKHQTPIPECPGKQGN